MGNQGRVAVVSSLTCGSLHGTKTPRFSLAVLKLISSKAGLSPEEAMLSLWGLSERFWNMSMPLSFSVLEFNSWSVITPVHPCNFIAFFITGIIYSNPAVILASAMVSAVSVSPSKMMKVRLDHIRHTRFSFFLCFLSPKCWLSQWNSSGFFFLAFILKGTQHLVDLFLEQKDWKNHPWQSCLLDAAEIMEDTVSYSFFLSFLACLFVSCIKVLNSCMADEPLELRIQILEGLEARRTLDRLLE